MPDQKEAFFATAPRVKFPAGWCCVGTIPFARIENKRELLAEYEAECSIDALGNVNPQWKTYAALEASGTFTAFGVFDGGAEMVGFAGVIHNVLPHYGVKVAVAESLFVSKAWRKTMAAARLMGAIERDASLRGCKAILYSAPAGGQLEKLLGKRYTRTNSVFCKPLS